MDVERTSSSGNSSSSSPASTWVPKSRHGEEEFVEKPRYEIWLEPMEDLWEVQKREEVGKMIRRAFSSVDPRVCHAFVLDLLDHSRDLRKRKPDSLGFLIVREFDAWLRSNRTSAEDFSRRLTPELRMQAFHLAASSHSNIFDILSRLYNLQGPDNSFLVSRVRVMLARQQFKEAATCVTKVNLHDCFTLEDICLPLIFQDKTNMVEKYVQGHPPLQEALIKQLDAFCASGYDINGYISDMKVCIPGLKLEKLRRRHLTKLILRLVKMFKLDMALCPNTSKNKDLGAIRYLLHKRYIEESMAQDVWEELIVSTVGDNQSIQTELIDLLVSYNDLPSAVQWARHYGIDDSQLPDAVVEELQKAVDTSASNDTAQNQNSSENWDDEADNETVYDFYPLNLPEERIILVSTVDDLQKCLQEITSKPNRIVGIDMEWRPSFTPTQKTKVALCQIATHEAAYLLDMSALWTPGKEDAVTYFFSQLLQSEKILKLGFEISGDYRMLGQSFPVLQEVIRSEKGTIDLSGLGKQILQKVPHYPSIRIGSVSLSDLVFHCFGKRLDKRDRISDWERRPLRQAQVTYAALDAFCLLEIYNHFKETVSSQGLQINMEPSLSSKAAKKSKSKTKTKSPKPVKERVSIAQALSMPERGPPICPGKLAVICDNMLQGLGKSLRSCGLDVKILENDDEHEKAVEISLKEGRAILTSGAPYVMMKSRVPDGYIMCVEAHKKARYQVQQVLDYFNVVVTAQDIFSRCQICNGNIYVKLSNADMRRLWYRKQALLAIPSKPVIEPRYDAMYDDFDGMMVTGDDDFEEEDEYMFAVHGKSKQSENMDQSSKQSTANNQGGASVLQQCGQQGLGSCNEQAVTNSNNETDPATDFDPESVCSNSVEANQGASSDGAPVIDSKGSSYMDNAPVVYLENAVDFERVTVQESIGLQVDVVSEGILDKVDTFFCCATCGKVFWEGKHFAHICSQFSLIIEQGADRQGRQQGTICQ